MSTVVMPEQKDREEAIFQVALDLKPAERARYVQVACGADQLLEGKVLALLDADRRAGEFLEKPHSGIDAASLEKGLIAPLTAPTLKIPDLTENPGDRIGRYKLLQKIGEGGCGAVYMAEQEEPVRRRVALKIIKAGMDTRQVTARFEAERQALAMMDHPSIARVLDAGATPTGRPFFVMDLVRGIRITEYCDQSKLSTQQRLELFTQVCHAIQHAHQKGIIHRDIKPSNILVTLHDGVPVPVIIDFGIAKATEQKLTDKTLFTAFEQFIGTPAYMSPEQAEMSRLDIDTRSDIYALGVLLYELLTSQTPFDAKTLLQSGLEQMRRTIREKEPRRPSTCLSTMLEADLTTVAEHRQVEPVRLISLLRGDLDWIVMKCLEKDRTRRYETANGLATDVERHLRNEPVLARPPSRIYRLQKMVRRNKAACIASAAVAVALVVGLAVSTYLFILQREAYERAVRAEHNQSRLRHDAEQASASATEQGRRAKESARRSRLNSYAADINNASLALRSGNLGRAVDLLEHQVPQQGEDDLRGFEWRYLWQAAQGHELFSLPHEGLVSCAVFSPDAQALATASYDGQLRVWDLATKRIAHSFSGFDQQFGWRYIAYSPNGRWLAGLRQGKLTVWECTPSEYPVRFDKISPARVLGFTPDSARLVGWGDAGLVVLDMATWEPTILRTKLKPISFPCMAIDKSGELAAVAHEGDRKIEIWNLAANTPVIEFECDTHSERGFVSLAWSPNGLLAATTWSGRLLLLDGRTGRERASTEAHAGSVFGLAFAPDGNRLVTAGHDQLIHFWNSTNLEKIATLQGHQDEIWSLAFSQDGHLLCTAGKDGTAKIWSSELKPPTPSLSGWYAAEFTSDGKSFATISDPLSELALDFWDVENPGVRTTRVLPVGGVTNLVRAILSSDAKLLGLCRTDGSAEVWSVDAGKLLKTGRVQNPSPSEMAFSSNGRSLAIGTEHGVVELWNLKTGQIARVGKLDSGRVTDVRFSPGNHFLRVAHKGRVREVVWDLKTGSELGIEVGPRDRAAFSSDGKLLATADTNYVITLWDLPAQRPRTVLRGHRWTIYSMAFSPDGKSLATGSLDGIARLWDIATGTELTRPLRGHLQGVTGLAFSPDGKALATSSTDNTVKIWHVATGRELFSAPDASQAAFSHDGNTLLLGSGQGARLLHVPTLEQIDAARTSGFVDN